MSLLLTITVPLPAWPAISHLKFTVIRGLRGAAEVQRRSVAGEEPRPSATPTVRCDKTAIFMLLNDGKKGREGKIRPKKTDSFLNLEYEFASGARFLWVRVIISILVRAIVPLTLYVEQDSPRWLKRSSLTQQPSFLPCVGGVTLVITSENRHNLTTIT